MTGNRPQKIPFAENSRECDELKQKIRDVTEALILEGYKQFYTGMAQGVDIWFAECVLDLQDIYPDIELIAAVPYTGQRDRLSISDRFRYDRIIDRCAEVNVLCETYTKYCMSKRNRFMVDNGLSINVAL